MVRATRSALDAARPDKRPFLLTRAGFLGYQRIAATWTGDNMATWDHLRWSIPMALNLGLSGQPFSGPDIGGFIGESDPDLFARWMGIGTLLPFCRSHKNKGTKMHEPWMLGDDCETACRFAIDRRYRLLPYLYTLFHEAASKGLPVIRPLFFADPADPRLRSIDDAFLIGNDILVQANVSQSPNASSPLPRGRWLPFELTDPHPALPRLFLRAGALIPVGPVMQHTGEWSVDALTLIAALDDNNQATGSLYEDDGDGYGFQKGDYRLANFRVTRDQSGARTEVLSNQGNWGQPDRRIEPVILASMP
jgi:alpha-glucosidase